MNKTLKALGLVFLILIVWSGLVYIAIAFLKAELNPFIWLESERALMLFLIFCYLCFTPLITIALRDEM